MEDQPELPKERKKRIPEEKRISGQKKAAATLWEAFRLPSVADLTARYENYPVRVFKEY